jgi:AP-1 complex subunit sigma 1/2
MFEFIVLMSRTGTIRLSHFYGTGTSSTSNSSSSRTNGWDSRSRTKIAKDIASAILPRPAGMTNVVEIRGGFKLVYRRYASLFFIVGVRSDDRRLASPSSISNGVNELIILEVIHHFVVVLDSYFGSVCELDIVFNFHKAFNILNEIIINGYLCETSKRVVLSAVAEADEVPHNGAAGIDSGTEGYKFDSLKKAHKVKKVTLAQKNAATY